MVKPKRVRTQAQRDRMAAERLAQRAGDPYAKAASVIDAEAARGMTDAEIAAKFAPAYDTAAGMATGIGTAATNLYGNTAGLLSGLAGSLPGGDSSAITSLLGGITNDLKGAGTLGAQYGLSLANDIRNQATTNISGAEARRDERSDRLGAEARALRLQGDVASSDYMTPLNNLLATRSSRQNLAMTKLQIEAQRRANEIAGVSNSGNGGIKPPDNTEHRSYVDDRGVVMVWNADKGGYVPAPNSDAIKHIDNFKGKKPV